MNIKETKQYYSSLTAEESCDCVYCRNYIREIKNAYGYSVHRLWGIWLTTGHTWAVTAIFALVRYKRGAWKSKKLV